MSVSNIPDPLMVLDAAIHQHKINVELQKLDDLIVDLKKDKDQVPTQIPKPTVRWRKRDKDGNILYKRPRSTRNQLRKTPHRRKTSCPSQPSNIHCEVAFAPETVESFLQELQSSLNDAAGQPVVPKAPLASTNWSRRKSLFSESWKAERPRLVNTMAAQQSVSAHLCQHCGNNPSALRCRDCLPHPFFCEKCDVMMHTKHVFHNRETIIAGFFQPLPPTTYVLNTTLCHDARFVPVEIPVRICDCPSECLRIKAGKAVTVVTINGRYDLSMPELRCEGCEASWTCGVHDLNLTVYWPATLHFSTLYATDVLFTFEEMKMAAPGLSCQAFLKMLDQRTVRFGRTGKISADSFLKSFFEWEAIRYELDKMLRKDPFKCQACTPDMLAVSVDGNRKHYRFKNAARSEEQALFQDLFIAKDEDVGQFVDYIHKSTKHTSGRGVCGGQWSAAREISHRSSSKLDEEGLELAVCRHGVLLCALNMYRGEIFAYPLYLQQRLANRRITFFCMDVTCKYWPYLEKVSKSCPELQHLLQMKPFLSVFHAKAHDFKCEAKWSGAYQDGAGLTLGEEVEQCNAFLSRIAVTTKHMSKAGRTDMLTLMAMRWNQQKLDNLATSLTRRYQKATKALQKQHQNLESLKIELLVTDSQLDDWVHDIKEWAEATSSTTDPDSLAGRIEVLAASIKRRSQRLYKDIDGNKARAKARRKIRQEKNILALALENYKTVTGTEALSLEEILSGDTTLPWQQSDSDSVSLATKRRAFDGIMTVKRLEEEKRILVGEMDRHWKSLSSYEDALKELPCLLSSGKFKSSSCSLTDEALRGLQSIILRELQHLKQMKLQAREHYLQTLSGAESVSFDDTSDDDFGSDSEASDNSL